MRVLCTEAVACRLALVVSVLAAHLGSLPRVRRPALDGEVDPVGSKQEHT